MESCARVEGPKSGAEAETDSDPDTTAPLPAAEAETDSDPDTTVPPLPAEPETDSEPESKSAPPNMSEAKLRSRREHFEKLLASRTLTSLERSEFEGIRFQLAEIKELHKAEERQEKIAAGVHVRKPVLSRKEKREREESAEKKRVGKAQAKEDAKRAKVQAKEAEQARREANKIADKQIRKEEAARKEADRLAFIPGGAGV